MVMARECSKIPQSYETSPENLGGHPLRRFSPAERNGAFVEPTCTICGRSKFLDIQGSTDHCRIFHEAEPPEVARVRGSPVVSEKLSGFCVYYLCLHPDT